MLTYNNAFTVFDFADAMKGGQESAMDALRVAVVNAMRHGKVIMIEMGKGSVEPLAAKTVDW